MAARTQVALTVADLDLMAESKTVGLSQKLPPALEHLYDDCGELEMFPIRRLVVGTASGLHAALKVSVMKIKNSTE